MRPALLLTIGLLAAACSPDIPVVPTGSSSIAADLERPRLAVANAWEDSVSIVNTGTGGHVEVPVGVRPTRIALTGDGRALVTLRGERAVAEIDLDTGTVTRTVEVGAEPYGLVVHPDGSRVYVAISGEDRVEERDALTLELLRTFEIANQPRWLAMHPDGHLLAVGSALGDVVYALDIEAGRMHPLRLPEHTTEAFGSVVQGEVVLASRVTGDPVFSEDGRRLVVPAFYVDNTSGEMGPQDPTDLPVPAAPYYKAAPVTDRMDRFNGTLVHWKIGRDGEIKPEAVATSRVIDAAPAEGGTDMRQGYITSVVQAPHDDHWLVTLESADVVLLVDDYPEHFQRRRRLSFPQVTAVATGAGPHGVAVVGPKEVYVHQALDRRVADIDYRILKRNLRIENNDDDEWRSGPTAISTPAWMTELAEPVLDPAAEEGRALFYSGVDPVMGAARVSCSTCHFEGRTDGLTWELFNGPRNTPSLAGPVSETGVVTWTNPVASVAEEARFTVEHRMGAPGLSLDHAARIQDFVDATPLPDLVAPDPAAAARGQALFERDDVGCAECHHGPHLTDGEAYPMYGLDAVKTRPLRGIASSPPYLHDGRADTLRDVLELSRNGTMGNTGMLSERELDDLEAYLRSL